DAADLAGSFLQKCRGVLGLEQLVHCEFRFERGLRGRMAFAGEDNVGLHFPLNLSARDSAPRARMPTSAPTATNSAPHSSQRRASASFGVRMPGALPALRMRRMAWSMTGFTSGLAISPV